MKNAELNWIRNCLPNQIMYPYYRDKYAVDLLEYCFADKTRISDIKKSEFAGLLNRPVIKQLIGKCGDGMLNHELLQSHWPQDSHFLKLTLGSWGEETKNKSKWCMNQVSRPEKNLVLQVNFQSEHDLWFYRTLGKAGYNYLLADGHPVNHRLCTLGWVRMDIDLDGNEVLIEEVQSDWVRDVKKLKERYECPEPCCIEFGKGNSTRNFNRYYAYLHPYMKTWSQILLSSALYFIINELGINKVWYHTNESGAHYKMIYHCLPPTSIYKQLPEKFGFSKTKEKPNLIANCKELKKLNRNGKDLEFYHLKLEK